MARCSARLDAAEPAVLDQVRVRLITLDEQARWDGLIATRPYLKNPIESSPGELPVLEESASAAATNRVQSGGTV